MSEIKKSRSFSPFIDSIELSKKSDFDEFYYDVSYKEVYRKAGIDSDGQEYGTIETIPIVKKKSIKEILEVEAQSVGIESYMRALAVQGESIDDYNTVVNNDKVVDYSNMPDTLADVMMSGDSARKAFAELDPALRGDHTTIEGFLNSLSKEKIDTYIKGKVDATFPQKEVVNGGE